MTTQLFSIEESKEGFTPSTNFDLFAVALSAELKSYKGITWFSFFDKIDASRIKLFHKVVDFSDKTLIEFDGSLIGHFCQTAQARKNVPTYFIYDKDAFQSMLDYLVSFTDEYHRDCSVVKETQDDHPIHNAETRSDERSVSVLAQCIYEELGVVYEINDTIQIHTDISKLNLPDLKIITEQRGHYSNEYASVFFKGEKIGHIVSEVVKYSFGYEEREFYTSDRSKWNEMIKYVIENIKYERKIHSFVMAESVEVA